MSTRTRSALALVLFVGAAFAFFLVVPGDWRGGSEERTAVAPAPAAVARIAGPARTERAWSLDSLPELDFDQALTLLATEAKRAGPSATSAAPGARERVRAIAARVQSLDGENRRRIDEAARFHAARPPAAARDGLASVRAEYDRRWAALESALARWEAGDPRAAGDLEALLRETGAWRPPRQAPPPESMPHRTLPATRREPRASDAEWRAAPKVGAVPPPAAGWLDGLLGTRTAFAQAEDDLGETPEVKFREAPAVRALLTELGALGSPVDVTRIAGWVRDHVEFVPIWGALQSSETVLATRRGTAFDIASLTIALLRAAGVRARYQTGTVSLPAAEAMNWLGNFSSADAAASLLAGGGSRAAVQLGPGGQPVAIIFEHVWVRAFVDYLPSRGACHVAGDTWIDIDAAVKHSRFAPRPAAVECFALLGAGDFTRDPRAFFDELLASATVDPTTGAYSRLDHGLLDSALASESPALFACLALSLGDVSIAEFAGLGRLEPRAHPYAGAAPPFTVLARGPGPAEAADGDRFRVHIRLASRGETLLSHSARAAEVGSGRFSLSFRPEGDADRRIVGDQIPTGLGAPLFERLQVTGVRVVPELRGLGFPREVIAGPAVAMGAALELEVDFDEPALETAPMRAEVIAGEPAAIALDLLAAPGTLFAGLLGEYEAFGLATGELAGEAEDLLEVILAAVGHAWFHSTDRLNRITGSALGCVTHRYPSAGVCASKLAPETAFGLPLAVRPLGITLDMPRDIALVVSRDGNPGRSAFTGMVQGFQGSALEAKVPSAFLSNPEEPAHWLGTSDALSLAGREGGRLALATAENWPALRGQVRLAAEDVEEIDDAVGRGLWAMIHLDPFQSGPYLLAGFALLDPQTGSGAYRVSRGLNGGAFLQCVFDTKPSCAGQPCCNLPNGCANSVDALARLWGGTFKESVMSSFVAQVGLDLQGDKVPKAGQFANIISNVLGRYTENADLMDSFAKGLGENARPLMALVVLFTALEVMNQILCAAADFSGCSDLVGKGIDAVQSMAWWAVANVIKYQIRTEYEIGGLQVPDKCHELLFEE